MLASKHSLTAPACISSVASTSLMPFCSTQRCKHVKAAGRCVQVKAYQEGTQPSPQQQPAQPAQPQLVDSKDMALMELKIDAKISDLRQDIRQQSTDLRQDIRQQSTELKQYLMQQLSELGQQIAGVKQGLSAVKQEISEVKQEAKQDNLQIKWSLAALLLFAAGLGFKEWVPLLKLIGS